MEGHINNSNMPKFILNIENDMAVMTLKSANGVLGSKQNLYRLVTDEGFFLPAYPSRAITNNYLLGNISGKYYRFYKNNIPNPAPVKCS